MALTASTSAFFEAVIGSLLFGIYVVLAVFSTMLHIQRISRNQAATPGRTTIRTILRSPMILGGLLISLVLTPRWILDIIDTADGFLNSDDPNLYFLAPVRTRAVTGLGFLLTSLLICDAMIVYRLWIVWNRSIAIVLFPILALLGLLAGGIGVARQFAVTPLGESMFSEKIKQWIVQNSVFNLVTNVYATALIAYRVCMNNYRLSSATVIRVKVGNDLTTFLAILVESSALLSIWIIFEMVTYAIKSPLNWFVLGNLGTISGISFMLINVRVALGWSQSGQSMHLEPLEFSGEPNLANLNPTRVRMERTVDTRVDLPKKGGGTELHDVYELSDA
ncbi:hypothetical protein R3P38DRAFT_682545 [Favolaschia claudopus]|uniref:Uncharacterized protein n=1 Tax=Favolaschia claudopus TaxID=2862362 RepID=A0AAW0EAM7_9AGAR